MLTASPAPHGLIAAATTQPGASALASPLTPTPHPRPEACAVAPPLYVAPHAVHNPPESRAARPAPGDAVIEIRRTVNTVLRDFGIPEGTPGLHAADASLHRDVERVKSDPIGYVGGLDRMIIDPDWLHGVLARLDACIPPTPAAASAAERQARAERLVKTAMVLRIMGVKSGDEVRELVSTSRVRDFSRQVAVALLGYLMSFGASSLVTGLARDTKDGGHRPPGWKLTNPYHAFYAACSVLGIGGELANAIIREGELGPTYNQPSAPHPLLFTTSTFPFTVAHSLVDTRAHGNLPLMRIGSGALGALGTGLIQALLNHYAKTSDPVFLDGRGDQGGRMMHDVEALRQGTGAAVLGYLGENLGDGIRGGIQCPGGAAVIRAVFRTALGGAVQSPRLAAIASPEHAREYNAFADGLLGFWAGLQKLAVMGSPSLFMDTGPARTARELNQGKKRVKDYEPVARALGLPASGGRPAEDDVVIDIRVPQSGMGAMDPARGHTVLREHKALPNASGDEPMPPLLPIPQEAGARTMPPTRVVRVLPSGSLARRPSQPESPPPGTSQPTPRDFESAGYRAARDGARGGRLSRRPRAGPMPARWHHDD